MTIGHEIAPGPGRAVQPAVRPGRLRRGDDRVLPVAPVPAARDVLGRADADVDVAVPPRRARRHRPAAVFQLLKRSAPPLRTATAGRFDAVRVDHALARRPGEHREAAVLRRDQRDARAADRGRTARPTGAACRRAASGGRSTATLPSIGSVTVTCSTCGDPLRRAIFAPNASSSYVLVSTVAPSTAVRPAIASTARFTASCHRRVSVLVRRIRASARPARRTAATTAYGIGRTIDSCQPASPAGTTSSSPPRPCARIDTASCTSTLTESIRFDPRRRRIEAEQRRQQRRAIRQARRALVDDLDLIALEHRDVHELARLVAAVVLHHEQPRRRDLDDESTAPESCARCPRRRALRRCARRRGGCRRARPPAPPSPVCPAAAAAAARTAADDRAASGGSSASEILGT